MQNQVFSDLKIDDVMILDSAETRSPCPKCGRSRKYFCYTCFVAVGALQDKIPSVKVHSRSAHRGKGGSVPPHIFFIRVHITSNKEGAGRSSEVERSLMVRWVVGSILHGVDPLSYFLFQSVLHDWCNKGCCMCYPICGMVHIKEPLLLINKSSLYG